MNIFGVFSTQGSQGLGAVKGVEAAQSAQSAARQEGVGEVHDAVTLSVDAVKAAILKHLDALEKFTPAELLAQREKRLDSFGVFRDH